MASTSERPNRVSPLPVMLSVSLTVAVAFVVVPVLIALLATDAVAVVEALDGPDQRATGCRDEAVATHAALAGHVGQVLGVVQERDRVDVGAQAQHLAATLDEPLQRRTRPVVVVPRHALHEGGRLAAPGPEPALGVVGDERARRRAQHLGEHADVGVAGRGQGVERLGPGEQGGPVRLGALVMCNLFRHPATTAQAISTLDHLSEGRAMLGLGAGWTRAEFEMMGAPFPDVKVRLRMLDESIQAVRALWTRERASFSGEFYKLTEAIKGAMTRRRGGVRSSSPTTRSTGSRRSRSRRASPTSSSSCRSSSRTSPAAAGGASARSRG